MARTESSSSTSSIVSLPAAACGAVPAGGVAAPSARVTAGKCIVNVVPRARLAVDGDEAVALADDAVHRREAEAGALADVLRREERLEQMRARLRRHADAVVDDAQPHVVAAVPAGRAAASTSRRATRARPRGGSRRRPAARRARSARDSGSPARSASDRSGPRPAPARASHVERDVLANQPRRACSAGPTTVWFRSTSFGISTCLRLNASSCCVSAAARCPAF